MNEAERRVEVAKKIGKISSDLKELGIETMHTGTPEGIEFRDDHQKEIEQSDLIVLVRGGSNE